MPPSERTERFLQFEVPQVDVLWIVDNSTSMHDDQALLAAAFPTFVSYFEEVEADWHVGVVTTDMDQTSQSGHLHGALGHAYIDRDTPDPAAVFAAMVDLDQGAAVERGIAAAHAALWTWADTEPNASFLHDSELAYLHFTIVSDEDDSSSMGPEAFAAELDELRPYVNRRSWNSVVTLDIGATDLIENVGARYLALTSEIGGAVADIRDPAWVSVLDELGGTQAPQPIVEFFLAERPVRESIAVRSYQPDGIVVAFVPEVDWTYDLARNSARFLTYVPPLSSVVEVSYTIAAE